ncbi:MAG: MFS transporter [Candidatus Tectomicrobia bacterium]|nr:MFS transporter [Candidatus Tectomicrobia bacterium]
MGDWRDGRLRGAAVLFFTNVVVTMGVVIIAPLLPVFAQRLGASGAWVGALFAVDMAARTVVMPFSGRASDRMGQRPFLLAGLALFCVTSFGFALATDRVTLLALRTFQGVGAGMVIPTILSYFGEFAAGSRAAFWMGTLNISFFGALAVGPFVGGLLESRFSLEVPFYFLSASAVLAGAMVFFFLPRTVPRRAGAPAQTPPVPWRAHLSSRTLRRLCAHRFLVSFGISTAWTFVPMYAVGRLGVSTYEAGIAVGAIAFVTTPLLSPGGFLGDRVNRWTLILAGTLLLALCLGALPWSGGFRTLVAVCGAMGLAQALYMPSGYALMVDEGRTLGMGASLGLYSTSLTLGIAVGPLVSGPVVDALGLRPTFGLSGFLGLLAAVAVAGRTGARPVR